MISCDFSKLDRVGLNLQAVFNVHTLPATIRSQLRQCVEDGEEFRQLILIGNAGPALWSAVGAAGIESADPIDDFSIETVSSWFNACFGDCRHQRIYPGNTPVGLQMLGSLAGWHHASPFKVGINQDWGTWFAYRVALLANTALPVTQAQHPQAKHTVSPCDNCRDKPCIPACPAQAMASGDFDLDRCIDYRRQPRSRCAASCVARLSCPVGSSHRYQPEQIAHGYANSLKMIERYRNARTSSDSK
ncbi:MAG: hypothetical protein CVU19_07270 [Betaproteobacteria bacterium HGW-Betaproteobacteria-13]|nr:MAG: hypothetical protein CVU19_07270 [Betaproteobacteria bacterium HGW-Betaproteobacteria-13]